MLVLARKLGEQIAIGDELIVTVVEIKRSQVRLGITAPRSVLVLRSELLDRRKPVETAECVETAWGQVDLGGEG